MHKILIVLVVIFVVIVAGCRTAAPALNQPGNTNSTPTSVTPPPTPADDAAPDLNLGTDPIEYEGYRITRESRFDRSKYLGRDTETHYAVLKRGGKTVMTFDDYTETGGNDVGFGLTSLLGTGHQQLYVEMTLYRAAEDWVIDLYPRPRVVYHSSDYGLSYGMSLRDVNGDGVAEITASVSDYNMFANTPVCCPPDVPAIFKYDHGVKKYVPANYLFQDYLLKDIDAELALARSGTEMDFRRHFFTAFFHLLYAGKEREAWEFFEKNYDRADKADRRQEILQKLANEPVFRFLHPHRTS